jgi:hypothetical protein
MIKAKAVKSAPVVAGRRGAFNPLFHEEDRVKRYGLGEGHADDRLNEDLAGCAGIAADALDGFGTDKADANGGSETAKCGVNATGDFCDCEDHVVFRLVVSAVRTRGTLPAVKF